MPVALDRNSVSVSSAMDMSLQRRDAHGYCSLVPAILPWQNKGKRQARHGLSSTYPAGPASRGWACGSTAATFWGPLVTTDSQLVSVVASPACSKATAEG